MTQLNETEVQFAQATVRKERLFFVLSMVGVAVGLSMLALSGWRMFKNEPSASSFVIAILILLNARQNLRQHKYARILRKSALFSVDPEGGHDG
ncbi:MAG: hypothetical protein ACPGTU_02520 [Myxococcota bacterium]